MATVVYGPVDRTLKQALWDELDNIRGKSKDFWILCGDFNVVRHRVDRSGPSFDIRISKLFNSFINRHNLIEHKLQTRKFTWSNGRSFALLDRIFSSIEWDEAYPHSEIRDLGKYGSDHCPLLLQTHTGSKIQHHILRFDSSWTENEEFVRLIHKWWQ